uniref:G_PROTEIN_RECEP_F1_2 domain-containing protein n=1 Tax=Onchocerca volvulus TaxID=6282 RepID=A0A8R1TMG8_ONCVO
MQVIRKLRRQHCFNLFPLSIVYPELAFIGLFAYGLSLYLIYKSPRYHNAFGILYFAYVLFHIQTISALLVWTIVRITVYMGLISFPWHIFSRILSPLANSTLFTAIWMQLVLAINRLWAISRPTTYDRVFSPKNARIIVVSLWLSSILITAFYYNVECGHYIEADDYSWSTLFGPCKHSFLVYIAMFLSNGILLTVLIVDAVAFYQKKRQRANSTQQRLGQELLFFKETCVTTVIYVFCVIISHIEIPMSRLTKIMYVWLAIHTLDGLTFVFYNRHTLKK